MYSGRLYHLCFDMRVGTFWCSTWNKSKEGCNEENKEKRDIEKFIHVTNHRTTVEY